MAGTTSSGWSDEQIFALAEAIARGAVQGAVLGAHKVDSPPDQGPSPLPPDERSPPQLDDGNLSVKSGATEVMRGFAKTSGGHVIEIVQLLAPIRDNYFGSGAMEISSTPFTGAISTKIEEHIQSPTSGWLTALMVAKIQTISKNDIILNGTDSLINAIEPNPGGWSENLYLVKQGNARGVLHRLFHQSTRRATETWFRRSDLTIPESPEPAWTLVFQNPADDPPPPTVTELLQSLKTTTHNWAVRSFTYYLLDQPPTPT